MASSRRVPTNENVSTYGAGQTYTVLATWEADTDNDLVVAAAGQGLACLAAEYNDGVVAIGGATTNASYFRRVYPQAGNFHDGQPGAGVRFFSTTDSNLIQLQESNAHVQDVAVKQTINSASGNSRCINAQASSAAAIGCLVYNASNAGASAAEAFFGNVGAIFVNCGAWENEVEGFRSNGNATIYNCTSVGNGTEGFEGSATTVLIKNCLSHGNTGADFSGSYSTSSSHNASEDVTGDDVGTSCRASQTFTFVNAASDDYHLQSGDGGAKDFGTDLSADGTYAFDDDIDRVTRSGSWDIGFDETAAAAGATPKGVFAKPLARPFGGPFG